MRLPPRAIPGRYPGDTRPIKAAAAGGKSDR
jgi:hypothetical protein